MNLIHEDLARAHIDARLEQARAARRGHRMARAARLNRRAQRATDEARHLLSQAG